MLISEQKPKKEALEKKTLASIAGETMLLQHEPVEKERRS